MVKVPCPLANSRRNNIRCRCPTQGGLGRQTGRIDLDHGDPRTARSFEYRVRILTRFSDGELLKEMAAEEGVSIKRIHDIIYETRKEIKKLCALDALSNYERGETK